MAPLTNIGFPSGIFWRLTIQVKYELGYHQIGSQFQSIWFGRHPFTLRDAFKGYTLLLNRDPCESELPALMSVSPFMHMFSKIFTLSPL